MDKVTTLSGKWIRVDTHAHGAEIELSREAQAEPCTLSLQPKTASEAQEYAKALGIARRRMLGISAHLQRMGQL